VLEVLILATGYQNRRQTYWSVFFYQNVIVCFGIVALYEIRGRPGMVGKKPKANWGIIALWCVVAVSAIYMVTLFVPILQHDYSQWYVNRLDAISRNNLSSKMSLHYLKGQNGWICAKEYKAQNHDVVNVQVGEDLLFAVVWKDTVIKETKLPMTNLQLVNGGGEMVCEPNSPFEGLEKMSYFEAKSAGTVFQYLYTKNAWGLPTAVLVIEFKITNPPLTPRTKPEEAEQSV